MAKKFTQQETEKLIAGIREAYEIKIRQLNYRLDGLVSENRSLRASLAEYKSREGRVGRAIVAAEEKGEEIRELYRMSAETELRTSASLPTNGKNSPRRWRKCSRKARRKSTRALPTTLPPCSGRSAFPFPKKRRPRSRG